MTRDDLDRLTDIREALDRIAAYRALMGAGESSPHEYFRVKPDRVLEIVDLHLPDVRDAITRLTQRVDA